MSRSSSWTWRGYPEPAAIREARHALGRQLQQHGLGDAEPTASLLLDELLTNVALHSGTDASVIATWEQGRLRVEVRDEDAHLPVVRDPEPQTPSGRGLRIVGSLARQWGIEPGQGGKTVWFELGV